MIYTTVTLLYLAILIGIIVYKSRSVKTEDDFVVAGRSVPVYLLVGTLVCTWIGSGSLFGTAGLTFRTGFSELWFSMGAWIGIVVIYFIAARVRKISQYTLTSSKYGITKPPGCWELSRSLWPISLLPATSSKVGADSLIYYQTVASALKQV